MRLQPLVSVLMTAYNREIFITEAIESVLNSSYKNLELIIVDDCSKDNTVAVAKQYAESDNRIKLYRNEKNLGDYPNRNKAVTLAKGEYFIFVDSDDRILPQGIEMCVNAMLEFPEVSIGMYYRQKGNGAFVIDSATAIRKHFFEKPLLMIGPGGTIIKRDFFNNINGYPVRYGPANDMYFNLKAICNSALVVLPFDFVFYRRHEGQQINNHYSYLVNNYVYLRDALSELPFTFSDKELTWLQNKNQRRFLVNVVKYFFKTYNINKSYKALRLAGYTMKDAITGIFH